MFWQIFLQTLGAIVLVLAIGFVIYRLAHHVKSE